MNTVSQNTTDDTIRHGDIGYVSVWTPDAGRAAVFYQHVLGWTYDSTTHQVTNTKEPIGISRVDGDPTLFCCYAVADLNDARKAITAAGGQLGDLDQLTIGSVLDATDPTGTAFAVYQPRDNRPRPSLNGAGPGELCYVTYEVADAAAFRDFYGKVLRWSFVPGRVADGWEITDARPMAGAAGGNGAGPTVPMWTVADIDEAARRLREAGGTVIQEPTRQPYGMMAECRDDQGARFYLGEF